MPQKLYNDAHYKNKQISKTLDIMSDFQKFLITNNFIVCSGQHQKKVKLKKITKIFCESCQQSFLKKIYFFFFQNYRLYFSFLTPFIKRLGKKHKKYDLFE